jgi:DNA repair exonuclease SbcCD ATPase subunit
MMASTYNHYIAAINSEIDKSVRREYLSSATPIIKRIITQAESNTNLLNYFEGINKELVTWTSRIPNDAKQVSEFSNNLDKSFKELKNLKDQIDNFSKISFPSDFKSKFDEILRGVKNSMQSREISSYAQMLDNLSRSIATYEREIKEDEAERKRLAEEEERRKKAAVEAERKRKQQEEENRIRREQEAERRKIAEEEARLRRLREAEAKREQERKELYIKIAKWAGIIIGAIILLVYVIIPILHWIWVHIVGIIITLVIIGFIISKVKD